MKKKIIQILMAILFAMPGMAQTVALEDISDAVPGPVTVDLTFSDLTNVGAITLFIEYDDVLLGYSGPGQVIFSGGTMLINTMSNHRLGLSWFNTAGQNITSSTIPLEFDYLGGFSSDFNFTSDCELATSAGAPINAAFIDGSIENIDWIGVDGAIGFIGGPAYVGEQINIPLLKEGYNSGPGSFETLNSITLFIEFDPEMLTYHGVSNNFYGFQVSQSNGLLSLSWSSTTGVDFTSFGPALFFNFTYNGGNAELNLKPGCVVTSGTEIMTTYFVDSYIWPASSGGASLTIADVTSVGSTEIELPVPPGGTMTVPAQVEVPILANGITSDAGAITLNLAYDADKLTYTGYTPGSLSGWTVGHSAGQLSFLKTNAAGMPIPDGTLLTLKFDYLNGLAPISFRPGTFLQEPNLDYIPVNLNDGSVNTVIAEITDQPDDLYLNIGETGSFTVLANNASSYQWYYREGPLEPWQMVVTGGTGNVLNLDPVTIAMNGWQYFCLLEPGDVETNIATLYVKAKISGLVTYNNNASTPLNNCTVTLKQGLVDVASTTTDGTGFYEFGLLDDGSYSIVVTTTKPWGGVNVADATLMQRHIANLPGYVLTGLRFLAGDVTNNNAIAVNDVTFVKRRIANTPPWSFNRGNWVFESTSVTVSSANVLQNIKGLTAGDVNGSYTPAP